MAQLLGTRRTQRNAKCGRTGNLNTEVAEVSAHNCGLWHVQFVQLFAFDVQFGPSVSPTDSGAEDGLRKSRIKEQEWKGAYPPLQGVRASGPA